LRVTPTVVVDKARVINKKVLGIGNSFKDKTKTILLFEKNSNIDNNGKVPLLPKSKGAENMFISFDFDVQFYQRQQNNQYFSALDIMVQLGGAWMFFQLLFGLFTPFVVISFLMKLATMIKDKRSRLYREGLEHLFRKTVDQLQRIKSLTQHPAGAEQMGWKFIT
jgi:hypothetical protein